jgi:septal ring factor EnvC (AmiA/AmiB activator)
VSSDSEGHSSDTLVIKLPNLGKRPRARFEEGETSGLKPATNEEVLLATVQDQKRQERRIDYLFNARTDMAFDIDQAKQAITSTQHSLFHLENQVEALENQVNDTQPAVTALGNRLHSFEHSVDYFGLKTDARISSHEGRIAHLEEQVQLLLGWITYITSLPGFANLGAPGFGPH